MKAQEIPSISPEIVWPWRLRHCGPDENTYGGNCMHCNRDVATKKHVRCLCIYCAIDRGMIAEDVPFP